MLWLHIKYSQMEMMLAKLVFINNVSSWNICPFICFCIQNSDIPLSLKWHSSLNTSETLTAGTRWGCVRFERVFIPCKNTKFLLDKTKALFSPVYCTAAFQSGVRWNVLNVKKKKLQFLVPRSQQEVDHHRKDLMNQVNPMSRRLPPETMHYWWWWGMKHYVDMISWETDASIIQRRDEEAEAGCSNL